jgi:hypothetical protein
MRKYEKRISELDMEGKILSKTIKGLIKEFTEGETELGNLKKALEEAQDDDEVTKINADIDELESALDEADDQLVHKLNIWHRNYDVYRQNAQQHLQKGGRGKKKDPDGSQAEPINPPAPAPVPVPDPVPATGTATTTGIITKAGGGETQVVTPVVVEDKKEEEGGWFTSVLFGALAIGGILIGVNLYKNRK